MQAIYPCSSSFTQSDQSVSRDRPKRAFCFVGLICEDQFHERVTKGRIQLVSSWSSLIHQILETFKRRHEPRVFCVKWFGNCHGQWPLVAGLFENPSLQVPPKSNADEATISKHPHSLLPFFLSLGLSNLRRFLQMHNGDSTVDMSPLSQQPWIWMARFLWKGSTAVCVKIA